VIHTNTVEGFYSIFKRGRKGVYQHCAEKHLHRYPSEFDFRYSNRVEFGIGDRERADLAIKGAAARRLTYRRASLAGLQKAGPALPALARKAEEAQARIGQILAEALDAAQTLRRECCFATRPGDGHQFAGLNDQTDRTSAIQSDTLS
jgi:hypothetical protein